MLKFLFFVFWFPFVVTGTVTYVSDGDTVHVVSDNGEKIKVRVFGIDCPESTQAHGLEAKEFVMKEIKDKKVRLYITEIDRYERAIAKVQYDEKDLSNELLRNGLAWVYTAYNDDHTHVAIEKEARASKVGLWADETPIAPWIYRKK